MTRIAARCPRASRPIAPRFSWNRDRSKAACDPSFQAKEKMERRLHGTGSLRGNSPRLRVSRQGQSPFRVSKMAPSQLTSRAQGFEFIITSNAEAFWRRLQVAWKLCGQKEERGEGKVPCREKRWFLMLALLKSAFPLTKRWQLAPSNVGNEFVSFPLNALVRAKGRQRERWTLIATNQQ